MVVPTTTPVATSPVEVEDSVVPPALTYGQLFGRFLRFGCWPGAGRWRRSSCCGRSWWRSSAG